MKYKLPLFILTLLSTLLSFSQEKEYPIATKTPYYYVTHGDSVLQNYQWMRKRDTPEIINYLSEENTYTDLKMKHSSILQKKLFEEFRAMMKENHKTSYKKDSVFYYYSKSIQDQEHSIFCRKKGDTSATEQVYLNPNVLAKDLGYFKIDDTQLSEDHQFIYYRVNSDGGDFGALHMKHIDKDSTLKDVIENVGDFIVLNDNKTVFYSKKDAFHKLGSQLFLHLIGSDTIQDIKLFESFNDRATIGFYLSVSKRYLFIVNSYMNHTGTIYAIDLKGDKTKLIKIYDGKNGVSYSVNHFKGEWFTVFTNENAPNYLVKEVRLLGDKKEQVILPEEKHAMLLSSQQKLNYIFLTRRKNAKNELYIHNLTTKQTIQIPQIDSSGHHFFTDILPKDSTMVEFGMSSLKEVGKNFLYNLKTNAYELKELDSIKGYRPENYVTERIWAPSRDGKKIPVDIVYQKGLKRDGNNPMYITGYGCYGMTEEPNFNPMAIPYLKRGFIYALAHPRGENILGEAWHTDGMLDKKENTIHDFVDATNYLIQQKYTREKRIVAQGGSAGGLLMGGIANERPDLYGAIIADVPFVNTLEDMLDTLWPNIRAHFAELGNPYIKKEYSFLKSYSPLHNIKQQAYPAMLVTNGYNDSRVPFWAAAQYTAKLRTLKTDTNLLLLKTNMSAGHGGASGRYSAIKDEAFKIAFAMQHVGIKENYVSLNGKVMDTKGDPIPYANVFIEGTSNGTVTNSNGDFYVELKQGQQPVLVIQSIGYNRIKYPIGPKTRINELKITLTSQLQEIQEVYVSAKAKNLGAEIIRKANKRKSHYDKMYDNYSVDVYMKGAVRLDSIPKKLPKFIKISDLPDSNDLGLMELTESVASYHFKRPDDYKEEMKSSRIAGVKQGVSFNRVNGVKLNFYGNGINFDNYTEHQFVSPIADGGILLYKYHLESTFYEDGNEIYKVKITPRNKSEKVFEGYIYIQDKTFNIHSIDVFITKRQGIDFIDTLYIKQTYGLVNDSISVPRSVKTNARIKFFGFDAGMVNVGTFYNYQLNKRFDKKFFRKQVFSIDADATKKDSNYWEKIRPVLLTSEEKKYNTKVVNKKDTIRLADSTYFKKRNKLTIGKLLFSGYDYKTKFTFSPLLPSINYNTVEGWNNKVEFGFQKLKSNLDSIKSSSNEFELFPNKEYIKLIGRYGLDSKKGYGKLIIGKQDELNQRNFELQAEKYCYQFNQSEPIYPIINTFYTLIARENYLKLYEKSAVSFSYSDVLVSGPQIKFKLEFANRSALVNHSFQFWSNKFENKLTSNNPLNSTSDAPAFASHQALILSTSGSYTFGERYELIFGNRREPICLRYPTIYWKASQGIPILNSKIGYTHTELGIGKSLKLGYWGKMNIDVIAGGFLNKSAMNFIDFKHFNGNQTLILKNGTFEGEEDNNRKQLNAFNALDYYSLSTNSNYLELHIQHRFLGILTAKLPLINRLNLAEVAGFNAIYMPGRNYQEVFVGVDNLFKVIRLDFVASYKAGEKLIPQVRIGVKKAI